MLDSDKSALNEPEMKGSTGIRLAQPLFVAAMVTVHRCEGCVWDAPAQLLHAVLRRSLWAAPGESSRIWSARPHQPGGGASATDIRR